MREFSYDSDLIGGSLFVREARVIADLLLSKADDAEWKRVIQTENRLPVSYTHLTLPTIYSV